MVSVRHVTSSAVPLGHSAMSLTHTLTDWKLARLHLYRQPDRSDHFPIAVGRRDRSRQRQIAATDQTRRRYGGGNRGVVENEAGVGSKGRLQVFTVAATITAAATAGLALFAPFRELRTETVRPHRTRSQIICGSVTSLSPFAVAQALTPEEELLQVILDAPVVSVEKCYGAGVKTRSPTLIKPLVRLLSGPLPLLSGTLSNVHV